MKRIVSIIYIALLACMNINAQTMQDLLKNMPDSIMPLLTQNNVLDFIDYHACNMKAEVTNKLGSKSEMTALTDDYTSIRMSSCSSVDLKLLPFGSDKIIAMVQSVTADSIYTDSHITFYSKDWHVLPTESFFNFKDEDNMNNITLNATDTDMHISFSNPLELDKDAKPRESIILKWNGKEYK